MADQRAGMVEFEFDVDITQAVEKSKLKLLRNC